MARIAAFIFFGALTVITAGTIFTALTVFAFTIRIITFFHFYSPVKKIMFKYTYTPYMYKCQDICYKIFHFHKKINLSD